MSWNLFRTGKLDPPTLARWAVLIWRNRVLQPLYESLLPGELASWLDSVLETTGNLVRDCGGEILLWDADAMEVRFETPQLAAVAALAMLRQQSEVPHPFSGDRPCCFEIGIHQGDLLQAGLGPYKEKRSILFGEALNFARRLCGLNREYGTKILVSDVACRDLDPGWTVRAVDEVHVKGISALATVFELLDWHQAGAPGHS